MAGQAGWLKAGLVIPFFGSGRVRRMKWTKDELRRTRFRTGGVLTRVLQGDRVRPQKTTIILEEYFPTMCQSTIQQRILVQLSL